ncbi:hypothetical protein SERLA73DRAFT_155521 [Serpula lacrymans var. lacrymans S7.3]|uniref:Uncharacterized protein n=1 Tax=Serpula lacrymans var. lacrymans (strain S7.3) TaxID=936435 RepID=F8QAK5_SERL3|nr:hypothetical protein SERLA73DRAFT_155521 [Serpula lacrymans var. lacrymans S7.3]
MAPLPALFHVGIEPCSGYVLWLKVWWTNHNPRLICGWYCNIMERLGGMPLITQSDPGTENYSIANDHTLLRYMQDPALDKMLVFHYVFIPWIQQELDRFVDRFNRTKPRHNSHKLLPHGHPIDIFNQPEKFELRDFVVKIHPPYLTEVRKKYAPPDHHVFNLVPPAFALQACAISDAANYPPICCNNVWDIYVHLLEQFQNQPNDTEFQAMLAKSAIPTMQKTWISCRLYLFHHTSKGDLLWEAHHIMLHATHHTKQRLTLNMNGRTIRMEPGIDLP